MASLARVILWGRDIGVIALSEGEGTATFQYRPEFVNSGIEVSPLTMPLSNQVYRFPSLPGGTFRGLPGLLSDSLPDYYGNLLIDRWLADQGREPGTFNSVERLCYTGNRGMGALEFKPTAGPFKEESVEVDVAKLAELAAKILTKRKNMKVSINKKENENALLEIIRVGTSAGGSRAKAVIAWNPKTNEVRSGQINAGRDFEYWILKFDGVGGSEGDKFQDPQGYGSIEFAYYKMAIAAGIQMNECNIFSDGNHRHFMTRRFDRGLAGEKIHMQSLCVLAHYDFNQPGAFSYEQALMGLRKLGLPMSAVEQQVRRMVFNIIARNQDDHVKNIAFLMDKDGNWTLSPAFDVIYSFAPSGRWTSSHQMTLNGKRDNFKMNDFITCVNGAYLKRGRANLIIEAVREAVSKWREFADGAKVFPLHLDAIQSTLRLEMFK